MRTILPLHERFWQKVSVGSPDQCWEWQSTRARNGYGKYRPHFKAKDVSAHRLAWELTHGPIPQGAYVLHRCDNRPCCNPRHLFLGTQKDNIQDMVRKQRNWYVDHPEWQHRGDQVKTAKLTRSTVREIRRRWADGETNKSAFAREFGVGWTTINRVITGEYWKDA